VCSPSHGFSRKDLGISVVKVRFYGCRVLCVGASAAIRAAPAFMGVEFCVLAQLELQ
jgi:hypothetical protein